MQTEMLPPKGVMCHRTGFAQGCRHCVVEHGCQLWVRLTGRDKDTGGPIDLYGCADKFGPQIAVQSTAQLAQGLEMIAKGIDHLRIEVQGGRVDPLVSMLGEINGKVAQLTSEQQEALLGAAPGPKMIGSN